MPESEQKWTIMSAEEALRTRCLHSMTTTRVDTLSIKTVCLLCETILSNRMIKYEPAMEQYDLHRKIEYGRVILPEEVVNRGPVLEEPVEAKRIEKPRKLNKHGLPHRKRR